MKITFQYIFINKSPEAFTQLVCRRPTDNSGLIYVVLVVLWRCSKITTHECKNNNYIKATWAKNCVVCITYLWNPWEKRHKE